MVTQSNSGEPTPLPDFEDPPVVEVALGVQFRPLPGLRPIELSALRNKWRTLYPIVTDQPPIPPTIEGPTGDPRTVQLIFGPALQTRLWFLSEDESTLVQVQHDRLTVNWRKVSDDPYPRYPSVRDTFEQRFMDLSDLVAELQLGTIDITQVEVNYINAVESGRESLGHLDQVFRNWSKPDDHHLGMPEQARVALVFSVPDLGKQPVRLYVGADPVQRLGEEPVSLLTLTVRGAPEAADCASALKFMDRAHEHVVNSFAELTPEAMHQIWRRKQ